MKLCEMCCCNADGPSSAVSLGLRRSHLLRMAALCLQVNGGEWDHKLLFSVPMDHPEVQRLEGRYKRSAARALLQPTCRLSACYCSG